MQWWTKHSRITAETAPIKASDHKLGLKLFYHIASYFCRRTALKMPVNIKVPKVSKTINHRCHRVSSSSSYLEEGEAPTTCKDSDQ